MPNRPPKPLSQPNFRPRSTSGHASPEVVDPRWLLKALGGVIAVALVCAYISACILFSYEQWQIELQPSRTVTRTPSDTGLAYAEVHFGAADANGQPQIDGWWIPGDSPSYPTVLMLHSGKGSISDALADARSLHDAQLSILLFDYRGFGRSGGQHPTEAWMEQDAESALRYLNASRGIPDSSVIAYGSGVGASLAAKLCMEHRDIAAMILQDPDGDFETRVQNDPRTRMVPVSLLFHEHFPLAGPLHVLATPKLLISNNGGQTPHEMAQAADPKMTVELVPGRDPDALHQAVRRFLDTYIAASH